jgi:hypothetical protein
VMPGIKTLASFAAAVVAGIASVAFTLWEFDLSLVCAALLAMSVGFTVQKIRGQS